MKKALLSILICGMVCYSHAQITIVSTDMPKPGEVFLLSSASPLDINIDSTGDSTTWDFSNLIYQSQRYDTMLAKNNLPLTYQFLFLTSSYAERLLQNISVDTFFALKNAYNIYKNSTSKFEQTAFAGELNGFPVPVFVNPTDVWYNFPMNYGDTSISNSAYSFSAPPMTTPAYIYFKQKRERKNKVDGWGKLILPMDTFDVLRVKSTVTDVDSVSLFGFGAPSFTVISYEYKFLGKGKGLPLLQINASGGMGKPTVSSVIYQDTLHSVVTYAEEKKAIPFLAYPNPANQFIQVYTDEGKCFTITDLSGRIILKKMLTQYQTDIDVSQLTNGFYFMSVSSKEGERITKKFVVRH